MRRGSVSSWRLQYGGSGADVSQPPEFMTSDGDSTKFTRTDGWFVSYAKGAFLLAIVIFAVVLAGLVGSHVASQSGTIKHDPTALVTDETEDADTIVRASVLPFIEPTRYRLQLTPTFAHDDYATRARKMKGLVAIEFRVTGKARLSELPLDARNMTVRRYRLLLAADGEKRARRRSRDVDEERIETDSRAGSGAFKNPTPVSDVGWVKDESAITENRDPEGRTSSLNEEVVTRMIGTNPRAINGMVRAEDASSGGRRFREIKIKEYSVDDERDLHLIRLQSHIGPGNYSLEIEYETALGDQAMYSSQYDDQTWLVGTRPNPTVARYLLPSFDDARFKSVFSVSVARPKDITVLTNMPLRSSRDSLGDQMNDTFEDTPPMSTHNLALAIGMIESISERIVLTDYADVRVAFWSHNSQRNMDDVYIATKLDTCFASLCDILSTPYPFPKLDIVNLPSGVANNIGRPGLISVTESLFGVTDRSPLPMRTGALTALIRLLGEQWLGGAASMSNWTDVWILEGSLLYLRHEAMRKIDSSLETSVSFVADIRMPAMISDGYTVSRSLAVNVNPRSMDLTSDEDNRYEKGACLIRMLHEVIGDTAFRNGYQKFVTRWKTESAESAAFWNIMADEAMGLPSGMSLEGTMSPWISQGGFPLLTVVRNYEQGTAIIRQTRFTYDQRSIKPDEPWYVPVTYLDRNYDWNSPARMWMKAEKVLDNIGKSGERSWVLFNVNGTGYYRVQYDDTNWQLLSAALDENHELFPSETRASLVDDVFSLAAIGLVKYETAFDLIKYMPAKERDYPPWSTLMRHMFQLNDMMYGTPVYTDFREFALKLVSTLYNEVNVQVQDGSQLGLTAMQMACTFDSPDCLYLAEALFSKLKTKVSVPEDVSVGDDALNSEPECVRKTLYCAIARQDSGQAWQYLLAAAKSAAEGEERRSLLSSFACSQLPWVLQSVLEEVLHGDTFDEDDSKLILQGFPENPAAARYAFNFVRANWQEIVRRFSGSYPIIRLFVNAAMGGLTNKQNLEDLQLFREVNFDSTKNIRHVAALVEARGKFVESWLKKALPEVAKFLKDNTGSLNSS